MSKKWRLTDRTRTLLTLELAIVPSFVTPIDNNGTELYLLKLFP